MTNKISQDEINAILWKACDTFRGTVDPSEYKNYILVMLFVKYISDVWHDKLDQFTVEFGVERAERKMQWKAPFQVPEGCSFQEIYDRRDLLTWDGEDATDTSPLISLGERINMALDKLEQASGEKLRGVFRNIDFNSEANLGRTDTRNERLRNLLNDFNDPRLDMRPSRIGSLDVIGNAYEYLIGKFAAGAGKKAGEFYTPPEVSTLLARLADPQPGDRICDPTCGSGSLLIRCAEQVGSKDFSLYGQESNGSTWALAKMNLYLHDMSGEIKWADTLKNPQLVEGDQLMRFDVVVANPPFSLDKWGAEGAAADQYQRFHRGVPPKSKGDYAFITHMLETIVPAAGRAAVIVPHGVLFRGSSEGKIRQKLIEENLLDAVIGLPSNLFYGTGIPAAILVFKKNRATQEVLFIEASREFEAGTNQNTLLPANLDKIFETYQTRALVDKYSALATLEDIAKNDFNLNIPRYVDTYEEEARIDLVGTQREISRLEDQLKSLDSQVKMTLEELGLV